MVRPTSSCSALDCSVGTACTRGSAAGRAGRAILSSRCGALRSGAQRNGVTQASYRRSGVSWKPKLVGDCGLFAVQAQKTRGGVPFDLIGRYTRRRAEVRVVGTSSRFVSCPAKTVSEMGPSWPAVEQPEESSLTAFGTAAREPLTDRSRVLGRLLCGRTDGGRLAPSLTERS